MYLKLALVFGHRFCRCSLMCRSTDGSDESEDSIQFIIKYFVYSDGIRNCQTHVHFVSIAQSSWFFSKWIISSNRISEKLVPGKWWITHHFYYSWRRVCPSFCPRCLWQQLLSWHDFWGKWEPTCKFLPSSSVPVPYSLSSCVLLLMIFKKWTITKS